VKENRTPASRHAAPGFVVCFEKTARATTARRAGRTVSLDLLVRIVSDLFSASDLRHFAPAGASADACVASLESRNRLDSAPYRIPEPMMNRWMVTLYFASP